MTEPDTLATAVRDAYAHGVQQTAEFAREGASLGMTPEQIVTALAQLAAQVRFVNMPAANKVPA